jgi:hypothetical protein
MTLGWTQANMSDFIQKNDWSKDMAGGKVHVVQHECLPSKREALSLNSSAAYIDR